MSDARRRVAVVLLVVIGLSGVPLSAAVTAPADASADASGVTAPADTLGANADSRAQLAAGSGADLFAQTEVDPDVVILRAAAREDGDATWTADLRVRLDDENATAAFESIQEDVETNASAFTDQFGTGMNRTIRSAENATGREMALANLTVSATTEQAPQRYGILTYRFTWRNFAAVDGDRLRLGDALSGFFLDSESSLVLAWPDGYERTSATPAPDEESDDSVTWNGRRSFGPEEPRVVVSTGGSGSDVPGALLLAAVVALAALLAVGWVVARRLREGETGTSESGVSKAGASESGPGEVGAGESGPSEAGESGAAGSGADGQAGSESAGAAAGAAGAAGAAAGAAGADGEPAATEPPEELLSNEERVIKLLETNGGRVKQQRIAEEFDWTDAKTSQVVGSLREEDAVETFRIGRENVVALPEATDL